MSCKGMPKVLPHAQRLEQAVGFWQGWPLGSQGPGSQRSWTVKLPSARLTCMRVRLSSL